jgi:hypothetical protein
MFTFAAETKVYPSPLSRLCMQKQYVYNSSARCKQNNASLSAIYRRSGERELLTGGSVLAAFDIIIAARVREMWQVTEL